MGNAERDNKIDGKMPKKPGEEGGLGHDSPVG